MTGPHANYLALNEVKAMGSQYSVSKLFTGQGDIAEWQNNSGLPKIFEGLGCRYEVAFRHSKS